MPLNFAGIYRRITYNYSPIAIGSQTKKYSHIDYIGAKVNKYLSAPHHVYIVDLTLRDCAISISARRHFATKNSIFPRTSFFSLDRTFAGSVSWPINFSSPLDCRGARTTLISANATNGLSTSTRRPDGFAKARASRFHKTWRSHNMLMPELIKIQ